MKQTTILGAIIASTLLLSSTTGLAQGGSPRGAGAQDRAQTDRGRMDRDGDFDRDFDRDRDRDRLDEPSQDRDRDQDRTHTPDFARLSDHDIYGSEVMSVQERNDYRMQLQNAASAEERQRIEAQHRKTVDAKARLRGVALSPPGQGIYGGALMSVEERSLYREQLRQFDSDEERLQFTAQHREEMQIRAKSKGVPFDDLAETEEAE